MADFTAPAPVEPGKIGDYLHDRSRIPAPPKRQVSEILSQYSGLILGVLLAVGACALVFELRDAWESKRDWVPPAALVPAVIAAIALGHLAQRGKINYIGVPLILLFFAIGGPVLDIWIHHEYPDRDEFALTFRIVAAVCLGLATVWLIVASLLVEANDPTKPPEPEM